MNTWNADVPGNWASVVAQATVRTGKWFHLAITFDSGSANLGECRIFLDGQAQFVGVLPMVRSSAVTVDAHAFALGRNIGSVIGSQPSQDFAGAIDNLLIFDRALLPDEIPGLLVPRDHFQNTEKVATTVVADFTEEEVRRSLASPGQGHLRRIHQVADQVTHMILWKRQQQALRHHREC